MGPVESLLENWEQLEKLGGEELLGAKHPLGTDFEPHRSRGIGTKRREELNGV